MALHDWYGLRNGATRYSNAGRLSHFMASGTEEQLNGT